MTNDEHDRLDQNTQKNLIALLCYDDKYGTQIATILEPKQFDGIFRHMAVAVVRYRDMYKGQPPGRHHMPTLIEHLPIEDEQLKTARNLSIEMRKAVSKLNKEAIINQASVFARRQFYKIQAEEFAKNLTSWPYEEDKALEIVNKLATYQPRKIDAGIRLSDPSSALAAMDKKDDGYKLGIVPFDRLGLRLDPKTLTLYLAFKNSGKSWFCVHTGRYCTMQGANVLHVTLEMSEEQVALRYVQNYFSVAKKQGNVMLANFKRAKGGKATGWSTELLPPKLSMTDPKIRKILTNKIIKFNRLTDRLFIKEFPTGAMTINMLRTHLTYLNREHNFQPNILIVDYPDLMAIGTQDYRLKLGGVVKELRHIAKDHNLAVVCPSQINRVGAGRKRTRSIHTSEAIDKVFTADTVLTYSQTELEKSSNLARLMLEHARDVEVGLEVALAQAYPIGQYVMRAMPMADEYRTRIDQDNEEGNETKDQEGLLA